MPVAPQVHRTRADIQGLRAIAVSAVVVYHFWPELLPGGFTGVDVFFVVSGFLITGQILRDVDRFGAGAFAARFWAARVRRILPAALLVLVAVLTASWFLVPASQWAEIGRNVVASALSIENWVLAADAVDYGAEGAAPSPVQHYWSLSVEEQFYVIWPLLLLLGTVIARRFGRGRLGKRAVIGVIMGVTLATGLWYSLFITAANPGAAYFITPARIWQLAAGGLVALIAIRGVRIAPWIGVAMIGAGFAFIDIGMPYPGYAALLPTIGTCLILIGGNTGPLSFDRIASPRPVQHLGDISYSVYLWHWPLLILVPLALDRELTLFDTLLLLAATLIISELTYRIVEQPFRRGRLLRTPARAWSLGAAAIAVITAGAVAFGVAGDARVEAATVEFEQHTSEAGSCLGAAALDNDCDDPFGAVDESAALAGHTDLPIASRKPRCSDSTGPFTHVTCEYGDPNGDRTLLLWGNSHASAWSDAADEAGKILGMKVIVASRSSCAANLDPPSESDLRRATEEELVGCAQRNAWVLAELVPQADIVLMADLRAGWADGARSIGGFVDAVDAVDDTGAQVIWIGDVPLTDGVKSRIDGPECLQANGQCSNPVNRALMASDVTDDVAERVPGLPVIDPSSRFCDDDRCYSGVGGVSVYFDGVHLSGTYSRSLGPWLAREIETCTAPTGCMDPEVSGQGAGAAG
ncbi:acyltransferase family protein [Microbacterium terrae]|uniref:O-acetyltransferase OatA n=2 Tax=Microbacterium terrae TaxID=69369 RepID=A0A0M2H4L9_9MICO|nr:O-acetyltransferase OatA [Microbacterium terrae]GLJ97785.1 acyltransferase [Microbacterium terrae]